MDGTPATEQLGGSHATPDQGGDPRTPARREAPQDAAPHSAQGSDEIHIEGHIILSEN